METNMQKIGKRIAEKRKERKISYRAMAESLGISVAVYKGMEAGRRNVTVEQVQILCDVLHVSPEWLLNGQLGLLECLDIVQTIQTTPDEYRNMAIKMPRIAKDAALQVKCE